MAIPVSDWPKIRERMKKETQEEIGKTYKLSGASVSLFKKKMLALENGENPKVAAYKPRLVPKKAEPETNVPPVANDFRDIMLMLASCIVTVTEAANGRQNRTGLKYAANDLLYLAARMRVTADAA